jgi:F-type H+-transporting ATPase subunit epsilon
LAHFQILKLNKMHLEIITPDKKVYSGEVTSVSVPGTVGRFEMLRDHAPVISTLLNGKVKIKDKEGVKTFDVKGGVVENLKNKIIILAESV